MQQSLTQSCNTISGTITDDSASFNGDQCSRINNLFSTSASHAMTVISKIDGFAKLDQLSTSDAETLERVFRDQGTACDVRMPSKPSNIILLGGGLRKMSD